MKLPFLYQATPNGEVLKMVDNISFCYIDPNSTFPEVRIMPIALLDMFLKQELRPISEEAFKLAKLEAESQIDKRIKDGN
jgi:hypothetical protein